MAEGGNTGRKRERPVVLPEFGQMLTELRGKRSRGLVVRILKDAYALSLDDTSLLQYERGTVAAPDPAIIWALCRIYGANFETLIAVIVHERTRRTIPLPDEIGGPLDVSATERAVLDNLRLLSESRQRFYLDVWSQTIARELRDLDAVKDTERSEERRRR